MTVSHNKTFVFVVLCLICVILYLTVGRQPIPVSNYSGIIDSMEIRVKERDSLIKTLEITRRQDSFTISVLSARLKAIPAKIDSIKHSYDYKVHSIRNMPVDSQLSIFSGWISQEEGN